MKRLVANLIQIKPTKRSAVKFREFAAELDIQSTSTQKQSCRAIKVLSIDIKWINKRIKLTELEFFFVLNLIHERRYNKQISQLKQVETFEK
jgi:hypothetical protein